MAEVRGVLVRAMSTFLVNRYGVSAVDEAITTLKPDDASLLQRKFLDASMYPYETMVALRRLARALSAQQPTEPEEIGRFIAEYVFQGVYRPLLAKDPVTMVGKIGWVKDFFYVDTEKVEVSMTGDSSCTLIYRYEGGIRTTRAACKSLAGFWSRTLELAGAGRVSAVHTACIAEGAGHCEFQFSW